MVRSIQQLFGNQLGASDGEIGSVKDLYFDDRNWAIRYLVADTGSWLPGRLVLISPYSLGPHDTDKKLQKVNLTRKQIEKSPSIDRHKPVSRQYEEEYYRYYNWPYYWQGDALWGLSGFPVLEESSKPHRREKDKLSRSQLEGTDPQLRSARAVIGYQIQTGDEIIGHICDFMINTESWEIDQLAIRTGHRLSGEEMIIPTKAVERISYEQSTLFATLGDKSAKPSPAPSGV